MNMERKRVSRNILITNKQIRELLELIEYEEEEAEKLTRKLLESYNVLYSNVRTKNIELEKYKTYEELYFKELEKNKNLEDKTNKTINVNKTLVTENVKLKIKIDNLEKELKNVAKNN